MCHIQVIWIQPHLTKWIQLHYHTKPIWLFNYASELCGFRPIGIVGRGCGVKLEEGKEELEAPSAEQEIPLTRWMVCEDWIVYVDSGSSSYELKLVCLR